MLATTYCLCYLIAVWLSIVYLLAVLFAVVFDFVAQRQLTSLCAQRASLLRAESSFSMFSFTAQSLRMLVVVLFVVLFCSACILFYEVNVLISNLSRKILVEIFSILVEIFSILVEKYNAHSILVNMYWIKGKSMNFSRRWFNIFQYLSEYVHKNIQYIFSQICEIPWTNQVLNIFQIFFNYRFQSLPTPKCH